MDPAAWLTAVVEFAPRLRAAGVRNVTLPDGGTISLAPPDAPPSPAPSPAPAPELFDPLNDPATFGGKLPGYDLSNLERERVEQ